jgi:hypothetical protein
MRRVAFFIGLVAGAGVSWADGKCRGELEAAFIKQASIPKLRTVIANPIQGGMSGMVERTVDAVRPDKVYSRVKSTAEEGLAETIVIGSYAWSNNGMGWDEIKPNIAKVMSLDVVEMMKPQKVSADFTCLGKVTYEGKEYQGYKGAPGKSEDGTELETTVYVDPASGLPAYNIVSPVKGNAPPVLRIAYSYPEDIVIEAPMAPSQAIVERPTAVAPADAPQKQ